MPPRWAARLTESAFWCLFCAVNFHPSSAARLGRKCLAGVLGSVAFLSSASAGTLVRIATPVGFMDAELYDKEKPRTVKNFLSYVKSGKYAGAFSHRLIPGFIVQGGGFAYLSETSSYAAVSVDAPVQSEFSVGPKLSNVKGTLTMALSGNDQNSATSQWFVNLKDNNTGAADKGNLDLQNGGFTVFGRVVAGSGVINIFNTGFGNGAMMGRGVYDASTYFGTAENPNPNFTDLPLLPNPNGDTLYKNLIFTTVTVLPPPPTIQVRGRATINAAGAAVTVSGRGSASLTKIEWRVGSKGSFHPKAARKTWRVHVTGLGPGKNVVSFRGVNAANWRSPIETVVVLRK